MKTSIDALVTFSMRRKNTEFTCFMKTEVKILNCPFNWQATCSHFFNRLEYCKLLMYTISVFYFLLRLAMFMTYESYRNNIKIVQYDYGVRKIRIDMHIRFRC